MAKAIPTRGYKTNPTYGSFNMRDYHVKAPLGMGYYAEDSGSGGGVQKPAWWDAARIIEFDADDLSAGTVSSWAAKVGSVTPTQATAGARPTCVAAGVEGHNYVEFDATDDELFVNQDITALEGLSGFTVFLISENCSFRYGNQASSTERLIFANLPSNTNFQCFFDTNNGLVAGQTDVDFTLKTFVFDGLQTGNANRLKLRKNGQDLTVTFTGTIPATTANYASTPAFRINRTSNTGYTGGKVSRILFFPLLTAQQITDAEAYINYLYNSLFFLNSNDLYLGIFGQSDAYGSTGGVAPSASLQGDRPRTAISSYSDTSWQLLNYPDTNDGLLFGEELGFAKAHNDARKNMLHIGKVGIGGTCINVAATQTFSVADNTLINDLKAMWQRLKDRSVISGQKKFVLYWNQWQCDTSNGGFLGADGVVYDGEFQAILSALDAIQPIDLLVLAIPDRNATGVGTSGQRTTVRNLYLNYASGAISLPATQVIGIDMELYPLRFEETGLVHKSAAAHESIGVDMWTLVKNALNL